jgi:predicted nucleotidyltransferase
LFDIGAIRHELRLHLGVPVDVLTPNALPDEFRAAVLAAAAPPVSLERSRSCRANSP